MIILHILYIPFLNQLLRPKVLRNIYTQNIPIRTATLISYDQFMQTHRNDQSTLLFVSLKYLLVKLKAIFISLCKVSITSSEILIFDIIALPLHYLD